MRTLTDREKRVVRFAAVGIVIYLVLFFGRHFEAGRSEYRQMIREAQALKQEIQPYEDKIVALKKQMEAFHMDPAKLSRATLVAEASSAIQKAAASGGIQFGPVRESAGRATAKELASIKLEGTGPIPAVMSFLQRLDTIGYPVIIDAVQLTPEVTKPGMTKLSVTIIIMDFDQWKNEEASNG